MFVLRPLKASLRGNLLPSGYTYTYIYIYIYIFIYIYIYTYIIMVYFKA